MPPPNQLKSRVDFAYEAEQSAPDADEFWKNVGKKRNDALEKFLGKPNAMEGAVGQIVSTSDPLEVKLRKIYDRVQHIRNTSFEFRKTQQEQEREKEKIDETVQDVWTRGYGNKQQLDWLFLALVRAAGFEAYGCWLSSRAEYFFTPKTMESGHLNETAVLVKLNERDLYFNPGAEFAPFGLLNWSETGTPGLRLDKDGGTWIKTTLPASSESRVERKAELRLSEVGDLEGKLTVTYTGLEAMYHRLDVRHLDEVGRKKLLEDQVKTQVPVATTAELTNQPDWNGSETPLVAEFDVKIPGWSSNAGKHVLIPAAIFVAAEKHIFEHANRVYPIYVEYPYEKVDDVAIEIPPAWQIESVPPAQERERGRVAYSLKAEGSKGTLHLARKLKVDFMILDSKNYPALRSFFEEVRTGDEEQVVLQPGMVNQNN